MPTEIRTIPRTWASDVFVSGASASAALRAQHVTAILPTVATTGTTEVVLMANGPGTVTLVKVVFKDALTTDNTNFATFALVNKGQANAGTAQLLATTPAGVNTTKTVPSGGAAIGAYTPKTLTLTATAGSLVVAAGDILVFTVTATGTLANTLTEGFLKVVVDQLS